MLIGEVLKSALKELEAKGVEGPKSSAEFLLRQVLGVDKAYLIAHFDQELTSVEENKFKRWIKRRVKHEPVWYITGKIEFYGQDFYVNENVLIPRPETEVMIERILGEVSTLSSLAANQGSSSEVLDSRFRGNDGGGGQNLNILDIGTGSGAIILTLAKSLDNYCSREHSDPRTKKFDSSHLCSNNKYFASDISEKALEVAKKNAKNFGLDKKIVFKKGDLFGSWVGERFDIIVTNLPYVPHEDMDTLAFDLTHYEPRTALDGGVKGLEIYERFFEELSAFVNPGARIYCEIGDKQGSAIEKMAKKTFPKAKLKVISDYADFERIVTVQL